MAVEVLGEEGEVEEVGCEKVGGEEVGGRGEKTPLKVVAGAAEIETGFKVRVE